MRSRYVCIGCGEPFSSLGPVTRCSICGDTNVIEWEEAQRRIRVVEEDMRQRQEREKASDECVWSDPDDKTCSHPGNPTPECHIHICPKEASDEPQ